jgi:hypothetical protein
MRDVGVKRDAVRLSARQVQGEEAGVGECSREASAPTARHRSFRQLRRLASAASSGLPGQGVPASHFAAVPKGEQRQQPLAFAGAEVGERLAVQAHRERPEQVEREGDAAFGRHWAGWGRLGANH